ncbi:uncharacterized protein B0I36DRAFT_387217 [Microdochium trichocladiopsis]|uniref:Amidohydrolase-related domain-containing protein n=1 Tax=Microdochium trichocladiopsis TaxID=1682393 RepID=A0A9P9BLA8_9PEZI|nr:uncharacterized protein B0I36DRAFT_387217 [Microdochium trichocladiopsis]KAH7024732.1 hypothetical protein B0I36DRAFT_387217 [Microdochium trichocladiopsis]
MAVFLGVALISGLITMVGSSLLPVGSWDSHLHIIDTTRYEQTPDTGSTVIHGTVWENTLFETSLGCSHVVIIQPTRYGNNNTATLEALAAYGPKRARAVVQFDPETITDAELREWHALGVRGVRINLANSKNPTSNTPPEQIPGLVRKYADKVRPLGWVIQFFISMKDIPLIEPVVPTLGLRVVIDHLGSPKLPNTTTCHGLDPYAIEGFSSLAKLLQGGSTWVKISAPYRSVSNQTTSSDYAVLDPLILELLRINGTKTVFGTDWPHTGYETLDIHPWAHRLVNLVGGDGKLLDGLFRDNARVLWDAE